MLTWEVHVVWCTPFPVAICSAVCSSHLQEAIQCLKDLGSRSPMHVAVRTMMTRVLDKKEQDNVVIGELLAEVPKDVLSVDHIIEGYVLC